MRMQRCFDLPTYNLLLFSICLNNLQGAGLNDPITRDHLPYSSKVGDSISDRLSELPTTYRTGLRPNDEVVPQSVWLRSGQQQGFEVSPAENGRRRRRQILTSVEGVALLLGELVEHGRVLSVERNQIDVRSTDGNERQEQDVPVDRVRTINAPMLELVSFVGQPLDGGEQVVAADRSYHLLHDRPIDRGLVGEESLQKRTGRLVLPPEHVHGWSRFRVQPWIVPQTMDRNCLQIAQGIQILSFLLRQTEVR